MAELKLSVSEDVKEEVERHSNIEWSKVFESAAKHELGERAKRQLILSAMDRILKDSKLTEKDALRLGDELKGRVWKRYKAEGW